jgi:ABC-type Na+ efflux pump permease subunit
VKTILATIVLFIFGLTALVCGWVFNLAGVPDTIFATDIGKAGKGRAILAVVLATLGQSYIYLGYVAFVVNWTDTVVAQNDVPLGFLLWIPALLIVVYPISWMIGFTRTRAEARGFRSAQDAAVPITFLVAILGFIVFAFVPSLIKMGWSWIFYIRIR